MLKNNLQVFKNEMFGEIRTTQINDEIWFVGKDIATALGYAKPENAIATHVDSDDTLKQGVIDSLGRTQQTTTINESGLYSLIISSKLSKAKQFKRWITSEVLPTIRKTGGYVSNEDLFINTYLPFADDTTKTLFRATLTTITQLNAKIEQDKPLVEFAERVGVSEDCISMNDMAKLAQKNGFKIGRTRLFALLRNKKILQQNNVPYQRYIETQPWFQVKESVYDTKAATHIQLTTMVTAKGQAGILRMLEKEN